MPEILILKDLNRKVRSVITMIDDGSLFLYFLYNAKGKYVCISFVSGIPFSVDWWNSRTCEPEEVLK